MSSLVNVKVMLGGAGRPADRLAPPHVSVVVRGEPDAHDPRRCESELARWGGAFAHVLAFTRTDGTVEHVWRRLVQFPPGLRGRVQVCRRCRRLVFHVVSIDYCSPECAEG